MIQAHSSSTMISAKNSQQKKTSPLLDFGITGGFFTTETTFRVEDPDPDSNKVVTTRLG
jgi:hypothetical protein